MSASRRSDQVLRPREALLAPLAFVLGLFLMAPASASGQELFDDIRSTLDGVYTEAQAEEGRMSFETHCVDCHGVGGDEDQLQGSGFVGFWGDQPLYALWEYMSGRMPYGAPGSLEPEEYAGLLAYILQLNGYPAGDEPLPHDPLGVANIDFDLPPDSRR